MSDPALASTAATLTGDPSRAASFVELTKPRITKMVTVTAAVGFGTGALARSWSWGELIVSGSVCLIGTALSSAGASTLNQWMERDRDAAMPRTVGRPLPTGRVTPSEALSLGVSLCVLGVVVLWAGVGLVPAMVSLTTILWYLLLYTTSKPLTPLSTLIGAVPGALPPLIGWTAARSDLGTAALMDPGGWSLFLLMFVWQIPHFLAIAWMYRDDYAAGGYRVLPSVDPDGSRTAATILAWAALLIPITLAPVVLMGWSGAGGGPGPAYAVVAIVTGGVFFWLAARLARTRTREHARAAFLGSIIHLPLILVVLVADCIAGTVW
ncbi:MAG: protoheme IX farnesyltransferase [Phycisphaerales bacterium]|nr:protoheme IX farnesyltransferase [Phycisphaerales bacterium]